MNLFADHGMCPGLVRPRGFEPLTFWSGGKNVQLVVSNTCVRFVDDSWTETRVFRLLIWPAAFFIRITFLLDGVSRLRRVNVRVEQRLDDGLTVRYGEKY